MVNDVAQPIIFETVFCYWVADEVEQGPCFKVLKSNLPFPNERAGTQVDLERLRELGVAIPQYPTYAQWLKEVALRRRCRNCYASLRGKADYARHQQSIHLAA